MRRSVWVFAAFLLVAACSSDALEPTTTFAPLASPSSVTTSTTTTTTTVATTTTTLVANDCTVGAAPAGVDEEGFFAQGCRVLGIDVVASANVTADAIEAAAERFYQPLVRAPHLVSALRSAGLKIAVIGRDEVITDLPPFADIYRQYPGIDWRRTGRSFAATEEVRWLAGAEENLLCDDEGDRYHGEDIFLRELARTVRDFGLRTAAAPIDQAIEQSYSRAVILEGKWDDTLAENNSDTYWMEVVQSFFDTNLEADPADTAHNSVDTREELRSYDPLAYDLAAAVFGDIDWRGPCGP